MQLPSPARAFSLAILALIFALGAALFRLDAAQAVVDDAAGDQGHFGYTECYSPLTPRAWISNEVWDTEHELRVKVHEFMHMKQVLRFESCKQWDDAYADSTAEFEAEAFALAVIVDETFSLQHAARWLSERYPELDLTFDEARTLIAFYAKRILVEGLK